MIKFQQKKNKLLTKHAFKIIIILRIKKALKTLSTVNFLKQFCNNLKLLINSCSNFASNLTFLRPNEPIITIILKKNNKINHHKRSNNKKESASK
jgi:hypothetical protein